MKNKTKKTILSIMLLILVSATGTHIMAQGMPVYDNTNFISLTKSLIESAKQTSELPRTKIG